MKNKDLPEQILATMRYCFDMEGIFPNVNRLEWEGHDDMPGAKDFIVSLIRDEIKKAYADGYIKGAMSTINFLKDEYVFCVEDAKIGCERNFQEYERNEQ